jgi:hypothetical protein
MRKGCRLPYRVSWPGYALTLRMIDGHVQPGLYDWNGCEAEQLPRIFDVGKWTISGRAYPLKKEAVRTPIKLLPSASLLF